MKLYFKPILWLLVVAALTALGPLLIIWALNTLFGLGILYTFWTWLATIVLVSVLQAKVTKS